MIATTPAVTTSAATTSTINQPQHPFVYLDAPISQLPQSIQPTMAGSIDDM
jgi:hypothetical protein